MAKVVVKGTKLEQDIASTLTAIAQLTEITHSGAKNEMVESDTLDNSAAGILKTLTGRTEAGEVGFSGLFDPALPGHQNVTDLLTTPVLETWNIEFSDATDLGFTGGVGVDITAAQGDLLRWSGTIELAALATYAT